MQNSKRGGEEVQSSKLKVQKGDVDWEVVASP
jgi:hypothetical protein